MRLNPEELRAAEDAGLTIVCGSVAFAERDLVTLGINANSTTATIIHVSARLAVLLDLDMETVASSLADLVQEMQWLEQE